MMRRDVLVLAMVVVACSTPKSEPPAAPVASATPAATEGDARSAAEPAAKTDSKKDGKRTFLVFCAKWVAACGELAHAVADQRVKNMLDERFVLARVDVTDENDAAAQERMKRYSVKGLPCLIVFDRKGKEVAREVGYLDSQRITKLLERAK